MLENSQAKLVKKNVDMICANNLKVAGAGFGVDTNVITLITPQGAEELPLLSKEEAANRAQHKTDPEDRSSGSVVMQILLTPRDQARAFLAVSVSWVNAALSLTASSASILRLITMPAFFRPFIKVE